MTLIGSEEVPAIEREAQLDEAKDRIDALSHARPVPDCVLFYYGVPTIGKTTILRTIAEHVDNKKFLISWIDFDRSKSQENRYGNTIGRINIIEHILQDIKKIYHELTDITVAGLDSSEADVAAERLLRAARSLFHEKQNPFIFFFDTIEDSDLDTFLWLQEYVLKPFVNEFPTLIVIASRTHPNKIGRDLIYPLERRTVNIALTPFDARQTERQIEAIGAQELRGIGDELNRITNGLPGLNDAAVRKLVEEHRRNPDADLRRYLVVNLIFEKRVAQIGADPQLQRRLLAVAPLRQFDAVLLRDIASNLFASKDDFSNVRALRDLLQQFQKTRLVEPHPDGYGYAISGHIRPMLDDYLRETNPIEHFNIHRIAADYFESQVAKNDWASIANRIYHLGCLRRDISLASPDIREQLIEFLGPDLHSRSIDLHFMSEALQETIQRLSDVDPEHTFDLTTKIRRVLDEAEFKRFIGPEIVDAVLDICDDNLSR